MINTGLRYFIALFLILICLGDISAQVGTLDSAYYSHMGAGGTVLTGVEMNDSTVVIGGAFLSVNRKQLNKIAKLKANGEIDNSFSIGTGLNNNVTKIVKQPDGRLLVGGLFTQYNGATANRLMRITGNGTKDVSFTPSLNGQVNDLQLQSDSMILVVGNFTNVNSTAINRITRLKYNGTRDSTFNVGTGANNIIYGIGRQSDGKYIIVGDFTAYNGITVNRIARINTNGSLDTTFNAGTGPNSGLQVVTVLSDNKIMVSGPFITIFNGDTINRIARLMPHGVRDTSFHSGTGLNAGAAGFLQDIYGRVIVVGGFGSYNGTAITRIMRLDSLGRIDTSFHVGSGASYGCSVVFSGFGNTYFIGGDFISYDNYARFRIAKVGNNGDLDQKFMYDSRFNAQVTTARFQSDGKLIVGGAFTRYSDRDVKYVARLNIDGTLDTTFNNGGAGPNTAVTALAVRSDDRLYIGGGFGTYNGSTANDVALLNADGTLNTSFTSGTGVGCCGVSDIVPLSDGRLYISGGYDRYRNMLNTSRIVRLKANGDRDSSFASPMSDGVVQKIIPIENRRLIIGGSFSTVRGVTHYSIVMLDSTGKVDSTYRNGQGLDTYSNGLAMEMQPDGRMIIGFANGRLIDGVSMSRIARLTEEGWLDTTYNSNNQAMATGGGSWVNASKYLHNGAFVAGSSLSKFLDNNGVPNTADFYQGSIAGGLNIIKDDKYGRLIMVGEFYDAFSLNTNRIVAFRNYMDSITIDTPLCRNAVSKVYFQKRLTFNSGNIFTVQLSDSLGSFASPVTIGTDTVNGWGSDSVQVTIPSNKGNGTGYKVRVISTNPTFTSAGSNAFKIGPVSEPLIIADSIFCNGDSIQLSSSAADNYAWSTGDTTKNIWIDTSGTYIVSVSINNCTATSTGKQITERTIQPPVAPAPQIGCSDSTYTFVFDSIYAGTYGNQIQWSYDSTFSSSQTIASGGTITLPNLSADTTIWIRSRDSVRGCVSTGISTKAKVRPHPLQKNIDVLQDEVYSGLSTYIKVGNTQTSVLYQVMRDTALQESEYGNGDTIHIYAGKVYRPAVYKVVAVDSNGCSTLMSDTVIIDTIPMAAMAWYKYKNTTQDGVALESNAGTTIAKPFNNYALGLNSSVKSTEGMYSFRFDNGHSFEGMIGLVPDIINSNKGLRILVQHQATGMSIAKGVYLIDSNENYYFLGSIKDTSVLNIKLHKTGKGFRIYKDDVFSTFYPMDTTPKLYPFAAPFTESSVVASAATDIIGSLHIEAESEHISCSSGTGSATVYGFGGVSPYHYNWSNGDTTATADSLSFGTYTVTVTDADTTTVTSGINIVYAASWDTLVNASVDTLGKLYALSPQGVFYSYGLATNTLPAGTDGWAEWEIAEGDTFQGSLFIVSNTQADESTDGMSVIITDDMMFASGSGIEDISYIGSYESGRGYKFRIAISDTGFSIFKSMANGATSSVFVSAATGYDMYPGASPLTTGSRLASLTASFGCSKLRLSSRVTPAESISGTSTIYIDVKGGAPPYTYAWSNSAATAIVNVAPGAYTVTITDANAQSVTANIFAGIYATWNKLNNVEEDENHILLCTANGSIDNQFSNHAFALNALESGEPGTVSYDFANGTEFCGVIGLSTDYLGAYGSTGVGAVLIQERLGMEDVDPGLYYFDGEGNIAYIGQVRENIPLNVSFERYGDTIDIIKNGIGRVPLEVVTSRNLHPIVAPLFNGDKISRVTTSFGSPLQLEQSMRHYSCQTNVPGQITITAMGGEEPYHYHWSNGDTSAVADSLAVGIYTVTVYDGQGDTVISNYDLGYRAEWDTLIKLNEDTNGVLISQSGASILSFNNYGYGLNSIAPDQNEWIEYIIPEGTVFSGQLGLADNKHYDESSLGVAFNIQGNEIYIKVNDETGLEFDEYIPGSGYRFLIELIGDSARMFRSDIQGYNAGKEMRVYCPRSTYLSPLVATGQSGVKINAVNMSFGCDRMHAELRTQAAEKNSSVGNIYAEVKGGTSPYTYHWSNSATSTNITGVPIGNYTVTITDQAEDTVVISTFLGRYVDWDIMANMYEDTSHRVICTGDTLNPAISVSNYAFAKNTIKPGETGTVSFDFEKTFQYAGNVGLGQNGAFESTGFYALIVPEGYITGLDQALYLVGDEDIEYFGKVRDSLPLNLKFYKDANGITVTKNGLSNILLTYTDPISLSPVAAPGWNGHTISRVTCDFGKRLQLTPQVMHLECGETNTGTITANASGGTPPYTYAWDNGDTTDSRDSLIAGTYSVTIIDATASTTSQSITVAYQAAWDTLDGFEEDSNHIITSTEVYGTAQSSSVLSAGSNGWFEFGIPPGVPFSGVFSLADQANPGDAVQGLGVYIGDGSVYLINTENEAGDFAGHYTEGQGHRFRIHAIDDTIKITKWDYYKLQSPVEYSYIMERLLCLKPSVMALETGAVTAPLLSSYNCDALYDTTLTGGTLTASADTICKGSDVTLILSGYSGTIQWQRKNEGDSYWANIDTLSDPTNDTITINNIRSNIKFRIVMAGTGCGEMISTVRNVTVKNSTQGTNRVLAEANFCTTEDSIFLRSALNGEANYTYQWQLSADASTFTPIIGAIGESFTFAIGSTSGYFRRLATQPGKCPNVSNTIKVNP